MTNSTNKSTKKLEGLPRVSMNPRHHYTTQSGLFDNPHTGPLTDARIDYYIAERLARQGITLPTNANKKTKVKTKTKPKEKKMSALDTLLAD